jgi:hypothetical protein
MSTSMSMSDSNGQAQGMSMACVPSGCRILSDSHFIVLASVPCTRCGRVSAALGGEGAIYPVRGLVLVVQSHCICRLTPPRRIINPSRSTE